MPECLNEEQLKQLAADALGESDAGPLLQHVAACSSCRKSLAEWRKGLPFMSVVRETLGGQGTAPRMPARGMVEAIKGYDILQELQCGAQGVVYRAVDRATRSRVAIKFLGQGPYVSEASRRRFEREIELVAALHHPGIIRILESGTTSLGRQYFVMNYVEGLPLHRYVWQNHLSLDETLSLFLRVCDAVNYAHQRGVIHRDLKPSNILVEGDGTPKVLDFGLARQLTEHGSTHISMTGQIMGTLPYMSPEQTRGDRADLDIRTDVYALGVVLYEILTGQYPYPVTGSVTDALRHIAETPPAPPSRLWNPDSGLSARPSRRPGPAKPHRKCPIDEDVDTIVLKALVKEPERRYANLAALMDDLSRYLRGVPIEARREAWARQLRRRLLRYKAAVTLTVACTAVTAGSSFSIWQMYRTARIEHSRSVAAQAKLAPALMQLGDNALNRGELEEASGNYRAAQAIVRDLLASEMHSLEFVGYLADCEARMGNLSKRRGDSPQALLHYANALKLARELAAADPANAQHHARLSQLERLAAGAGGGAVAPTTRPAAVSPDRGRRP